MQQQSIVKAAQNELSEIQIMYEEAQTYRDWMKKEMNHREDTLHRYKSSDQESKYKTRISKLGPKNLAAW